MQLYVEVELCPKLGSSSDFVLLCWIQNGDPASGLQSSHCVEADPKLGSSYDFALSGSPAIVT